MMNMNMNMNMKGNCPLLEGRLRMAVQELSEGDCGDRAGRDRRSHDGITQTRDGRSHSRRTSADDSGDREDASRVK
jgi:hypothetical protein